MTDQEYEVIKNLIDGICGLITPENLPEFGVALTAVLGQTAVAAEMPAANLVMVVVDAYRQAEAHPEDGADLIRLLAMKRAAGWH